MPKITRDFLISQLKKGFEETGKYEFITECGIVFKKGSINEDREEKEWWIDVFMGDTRFWFSDSCDSVEQFRLQNNVAIADLKDDFLATKKLAKYLGVDLGIDETKTQETQRIIDENNELIQSNLMNTIKLQEDRIKDFKDLLDRKEIILKR